MFMTKTECCIFIQLLFFFAAASGPVRLFTPYKRRRRNQLNLEQGGLILKVKKQSEDDSENDQNIVTKEEPSWQQITDGIDNSNGFLDTTQCE